MNAYVRQWIGNHAFLTTLILAALIVVPRFVDERRPWLKALPRYLLVVAFAWIVLMNLPNGNLYFYAFLLGMLTAFSEIISKFTDEPIKALSAIQAVFYHALNGFVSAFAFWVLLLYSPITPTTTALDKLKDVVVAGLGSMLLLRSKLFNVKVDGDDLSFGPEQIVRVFFNYMELAIDRIRAQARILFVRRKLDNIDFAKVRPYTEAMLRAAQTLNDAELKKIKDSFDEIAARADLTQVKSYSMGFVLLNEMGEDFVQQLFSEPAAEWLIGAPDPTKDQGIIPQSIFPSIFQSRDVFYFSYGGDMSSSMILSRLNWTSYGATKIKDLNPQNAVLNGYTLVFDHPTSSGDGGFPNLKPSPNSSVEGVLYKLSASVMDFLDRINAGYTRQKIEVEIETDKGTKKVDAQAYIAEDRKDGLAPNHEYLSIVLQGGKEHDLSPAYLARVSALQDQSTAAKPAAASLPPQAPVTVAQAAAGT